MAEVDVAPNTRISGDNYIPGPDGHIRHPRDKALVWWEDEDGKRFWVRQSPWSRWFDIKNEKSPTQIQRTDEPGRKRLCKDLRSMGIRYKVRPVPLTGWDAAEGPWQAPDEEEVA